MGAALFAVAVIAFAAAQFGILPMFWFEALFAAVIGNGLAGAAMTLGAGRAAALTAGAAVALGGLATLLIVDGARLAPYFALALINAGVAIIFGRGLGGGARESVILQIIRVTKSGPEADPEFRRFVWGQCLVWTLFGAATAMVGALGMVSEGARPMANAALSMLIPAQIFWFVGTHSYAQRRHQRPESWLDTIRYMSRPDVWRSVKL